MKPLPTAEEIRDKVAKEAGYESWAEFIDLHFMESPHKFLNEITLKFMKQYGRIVRDRTLEWASENTEQKHVGDGYYVTDKQSVLHGKICDKLKI